MSRSLHWRKRKWLPFILLAILIAFLLTLNIESANRVRTFFFGFLPLSQKTELALSETEQSLQTENYLLKRTLKELSEQIQTEPADPLYAAARLFYRSPALWNNYCWIDQGARLNEELGTLVIAKNSPVIVGNALVGLIEKTERNHSLVRLITDPALTPSVRAVRLETQTGEKLYLAKGYLHGNGEPLWRSRGRTLTGVGFNFDFADEKGKERDLRTPLLITAGDELVTTGLDGIFPEGLSVAHVTKIQKLREGDYFYSLDAIPSAGPMEELSVVFVLPPLHTEQTLLSP